jgi:GT2 family glycosyltransferase/glycosyltransferase involved in cell wall biosynthesis
MLEPRETDFMNTPLIVTGMHRSGTSLIASLLAAWNVRMGDRLLPADHANPAGYMEDIEFLDLNRRMLVACTPDEPGHRDWGWTEGESFDASAVKDFHSAAASLVSARKENGGPWGWKDPRTSMLLEFWDDLLEHEARFLLLYRHPWEVADSMLRTGADVWLRHPDYPARIWATYNRRLLDFHRRHRDRTLLVSTNRILRDPGLFATAMQRHASVPAAVDTLATLRLDRSFISRTDDPLVRLWRHTNPEAIELLGALDDAADLGNERVWEPASRSTPSPADNPRLSVIIPCHDDGDFDIDAAASVERHAPAAEVVIVDDGSTSARTIEVLAALREAGHRVIHQENAGLSAARNAGIAASTGEYILPLDADNRLLPGFVEEAIALLDSDPAAGIAYGDRREFGGRNADVAVPEFDLPQMLWSNYIDACAVVRRQVWTTVGGYEPSLRDWEDWDFWLSAAERGWRFVHLPRPTFEYRIRPDSLHQRFLRGNAYMATLRRVYERHRESLPAHAAETLIAAHEERRRLFADAAALKDSRDRIQAEIDRIYRGSQEQTAALRSELSAMQPVLSARDEELGSIRNVLNAREIELASVKEVLEAHDEELASVKFVLQARDEELSALRTLHSALATDEPVEESALTSATAVFTIVARNYIAYARVLAASLARHDAARLHVILLDDDDHLIAEEPAFEIIRASALPFDRPSDLYTMAAIYDVTELATAVKPWAFQYLFARGAEVAIYLDPDIHVFDSLGPLESWTREHGMLLTPHITQPLPRDGKHPSEQDLLLSGIYNLGFLALSAETATTFLPWWCERLRRDCLNDPAQGLFVDQRWIDFAPSLFEPHVVKDPGYNAAYWNLPHRNLERDGDRILVNGQPLRFFHFSGFSPRVPHLLSKHQLASPRVRLSDSPVLTEICERYASALGEAGFEESSALPYGFAVSGGGLPLDTWMRRVLRRTYLQDEARDSGATFPNPFSDAGSDDMLQRLLRPSPYSPDVPAYLGELWSARADLRLAFPRIDSVDAQRFLEWVRTQGVREHDIPPQLIPPRAEVRTPASSPRTLKPGVNVYGYAFAESGTGQIVRSVVAALAAEGIPYAVVPFTRTISRQQRVFSDLGSATPSFDTNLICVNADQVPLFFESMRGQLLPGARNIGLWAWEVEDLPSAMAASENYLDEVWGISEFTAATLRRSLTRPVHAFPLPVVVPEVRKRTREELGMPEGFLFLFCFDYDSVFRRKNPLAVVAAFRKAFANRKDVVLYLKTTNAERHAAEAEALYAAARGCANIVIRDAYVSNDDYFSMLDSCDCYVSLHRSEGFGLTIAEAMALGKPVISTAYSSTLEFTNDTNSYLVPAPVVAVGADAPPYPPQSRWAEPDVAIAAEQMMRVYDDRSESEAIGIRAKSDIETLHGPAARGVLLRHLLDQNRAARGNRGTRGTEEPRNRPVEETRSVEATIIPVEPRLQPAGEFEAHAMVAESLLGSPRSDLPSAMQRVMTPIRGLILRCIRVYWVQQLGVDRALLAAMRVLSRESRNEAASLAVMVHHQNADVAKMRAELTGLANEVRTLNETIDAMRRPHPVDFDANATGIHAADSDEPAHRGRTRR